MSAIKFAMIGSGWRAEFFLRIAASLPEQFDATRVMVRSERSENAIATQWRIPTTRSIDDLLKDNPEFVVVSVPWDVCPVLIKDLVGRGAFVLAETPPAPTVDELEALFTEVGKTGHVQVAEQYPFQPIHAACIGLARSGKIGDVTQTQVSAAHGYHGIALIRALLGSGFSTPTISALNFSSPIIAGPGRGGPPSEHSVSNSNQVIATLNFGDKLGVFDFTGDQYFSWIRQNRLLVRGERGEMTYDSITYLEDFATPVQLDIHRRDTGHAGNLEGHYLSGLTAGNEWIYKNPFVPARFTDDEIAVATCLKRMSEYIAGGPDAYSLADASQDHYLGICIDKAVSSGKPVETSLQPWS